MTIGSMFTSSVTKCVLPHYRRYASSAKAKSPSFLNGESSTFAARPVLHNAAPRLPLLYYKASARAMESINHRVFYANWIFVFAFYDILTSFVDF